MQLEQCTININDDFDLDKIIESGQCFRPKRLAGGQCRFITGRHLLYISEQPGGGYEVLCEPGAWQSVWCAYFDLDRSYAAIRRQLAAHGEPGDFLCRSLDYGAGIRILRQEPWETLISFIISQRKSIPAIRTAIEALASRFGEEVGGAGETVRLFPTAASLAAAPESELRACGLGYRTGYVQNAARKAAGGELDLAALGALSDTELFARLLGLEGVGKKVANCVCLFGYGRTAMAPVDVWIQKLIDEEFGGKDPFSQYGAAAGIAQQYMFGYERDTHRAAKAKK